MTSITTTGGGGGGGRSVTSEPTNSSYTTNHHKNKLKNEDVFSKTTTAVSLDGGGVHHHQRQHHQNNHNSDNDNNNDNNNANDLLTSSWNEMEQQIQQQSRMEFYEVMRQYKPWYIRVLKWLVRIFVTVDILMTVLLVTYTSVLYYYYYYYNHDSKQENQQSIPPPVAWLQGISIWTGFVCLKTCMAGLSLLRRRRRRRSSSSSTSTCCSCCCYHRWGLYCAASLAGWTAMIYIVLGLTYSAIALDLTKFSTNIVSQYIQRHEHELCLPTPVFHVLVDYVTQPKYLHYVCMGIAAMTAWECIQCQVYHSYRFFLIQFDEYYAGDHNNNGNNNNDYNDDDDYYNAWEHLQEPLLPEQPPRFGIPAWVTPTEEQPHTLDLHHNVAENTAPAVFGITNASWTTSNSPRKSLWSRIFRKRRRHNDNHTTTANNDNGNDDDEGSADMDHLFSNIQDEWASRSEEDPFWWSRDDYQIAENEKRRRQQQALNQMDPHWAESFLQSPTQPTSDNRKTPIV